MNLSPLVLFISTRLVNKSPKSSEYCRWGGGGGGLEGTGGQT